MKKYLFLIVLWGNSCHAALIIDVFGDVGSGVTSWFFEGSYVTTSSTSFDQITVNPSQSSTSSTRLSTGVNYFQHSSGEATSELADAEFFNDTSSLLTGSAQVNGSTSGQHIINGLYIDWDSNIGDDDFGWFAGGSFDDGETLTFSGSGSLLRDISEFGIPQLAAGESFVFSSTSEITPLTITFSATDSVGSTSIREPGNITLMTLSILLLWSLKKSKLVNLVK
ncbi:hypothetical protein [Alteromonas sp. KUL49]|uniref:hypothetical protein n=1 Tax=Alteromonas sp. KUL49 TaxID=2480798 RepID=UPI00102ED542|nr:hypothetical protein [Alteromonas sp. KUL49]TAP42290.1 hypothetical protein EYS00_01345 [Alteromonas sp. KUL49]GEA09896.1 hypothetical protein KUL49_02710 [Alteromonas sp. KUL49]